MWNLCGVVVCHAPVVNWRRGWGQSVMKINQCNDLPEIHAQLMGVHLCSGLPWICGWLEEGVGPVCHEIMWCNGLPKIHAPLTGGSIGQSRFICQIWTHLHFMLCFIEGLFILHMKDLTSKITLNQTFTSNAISYLTHYDYENRYCILFQWL